MASEIITQSAIGIAAIIVLIVSAEVSVRKILRILSHYRLSTTFGGLFFSL